MCLLNASPVHQRIITELKCRFSSDGTLTLEAPFVPPIEEKNEAIQDTDIPVQHT